MSVETEESITLDVDMEASLVCEAKHERVYDSGEVMSAGPCDVVASYRFHDCINRMLVCESFRQQAMSEIRDWSRCWLCSKLHTDCIEFINI